MALYLGLDNSTQSLSAILVDANNHSVVAHYSVNYETDLPDYGLRNGVVPETDPLEKFSDPLVWVAALELLLERMCKDGVDMSSIKGISGSAQQHGTVFLKKGFSELRPADITGDSLVPVVEKMLSRRWAPIWMDSSTTEECRELTEHAGSESYIQKTTGSPAIERFSASQIRKFYKQDPENYAQTATIHLISSFMASLLMSGDAPMDHGDATGMNLMDLHNKQWDPLLLEAAAPGLAERLPALTPSDKVVGKISDYFIQKFGFSPDTSVVAWSGDNPCSLIGVGAWSADTAVISLGTSDTYFAAMDETRVDPAGYGHVFGNPAGGYMALVCFKNGSLAREKIKDNYGLSWQEFDEMVREKTPAGNNGNMMLPLFVSEITPHVLHPRPLYKGSEAFVGGRDAAAAVKAVVEGQALNMRYHSKWIGEGPSQLRVTGGAAKNEGICRVLADVFNARVDRLEVENAAALGSAMRAEQACTDADWATLTSEYCTPDASKALEPIPPHVEAYNEMLPKFEQLLSDFQQKN